MNFDPRLLQMLASSNSGAADIQNLMGELDMSPKAKMLMQMMNQNQAHIDDEFEAPTPRDRTLELTRKAKKRINSLKAELEDAWQMIDIFADCVGACSLCFGEHDDCEDCHGNGRPGWRRPNRELFNHFVQPALRWFNVVIPRDGEQGALTRSEEVNNHTQRGLKP